MESQFGKLHYVIPQFFVLNLLFQKIDFGSETLGGIERHTITLIKGLSPKNFKFFFAYSHIDDYCRLHPEIAHNEVVAPDDLYISKRTEAEVVRNYLLAHHIDVIHIQQQNNGYTTTLFHKAVQGLPIRIVATYHFLPGYELNELNYRSCWALFLQRKGLGEKLKWFKRLLFLPLYRKNKEKQMQQKLSKLYNFTDDLVMLSPCTLNLFMKLCPVASRDGGRKLRYIYNCVSFDRTMLPEEVQSKRKEIIIVSRLEEAYKRLSIAINLWKRIVAEGLFPDWSMTIVGEGYSFNTYLKMIEGVPGVAMVGRKPSLEYFARSAIYLNTSLNEGMSLALMEAMQMGAVPMSFNSWETVFDVIDDGTNGFIIKEGDLEGYYNKLVLLMSDQELRRNMAVQAIEKSKIFSRERFNREYQKLYDQKNAEQ